MDDGIIAIIIILSVLSIAFLVFIYLLEGLLLVFLIISIILLSLLMYLVLCIIATKWDAYSRKKEWIFLEEMEKIRPVIGDDITQGKKPET